MSESFLHTNRLIKEKSPYLLQHAHNPVDWYPWGEEAFQEAIKKDKPIFLSIGYATCHWCHVMETDCFENIKVAKLLNECFINIKVDREELPEVDSLYMEFAQSMMAGAAGWPLNVILTPQLQPFFAATYLPAHSREGVMGMTELIVRINEVWESDEKKRVIIQAQKLVEVFQENIHVKGEVLPDKKTVESAVDLLYKMSDSLYGGMKGAPKFPIPYQLSLLLTYSFLHHDSRALFITERTLDMMQRGGIWDHLGGGFSRYSTDEMWHIPHFEKMLYDNALLIEIYLTTWKVTKRDFYKEIAEEIIQYALRDMRHPEGGFYSAEDSDSEGVEGLFYTWTEEEVFKTLGTTDGALFCKFFSITKEGNFEERSVLYAPRRPDEFAVDEQLDPLEFELRLAGWKQKLKEEREKRTRPFKDDKILASWNALMLHALAEAGMTWRVSAYKEAAISAAEFMYKHMWAKGQLYRRFREGERHFLAELDEYAYLIRGLLTLFEGGWGLKWLRWAIEMTEILQRDFKEPEGAFYQTDGSDPHLILRRCQFADGAEPSGNAIHCENLLRLFQITYDPKYRLQAEDILKGAAKYLETYPPGYSYHVLNVMKYYYTMAPTIVVALNAKRDHQEAIEQHLFSAFIPCRAVIWRTLEELEELSVLIPFVKEQIPLDGFTTVYICRGHVCGAPLTDLQEIKLAIALLHKSLP